MHAATDLLTGYARDHRDERNIASHLLGIPLVVFALGVLSARPSFALAGHSLSPAWAIFAVAAAWYLVRAGLVLGLAVSAAIAALLLAAHRLTLNGSVLTWLGWGVGTFLAGWFVQVVGHCYEGRPHPSAADASRFLVGPLFVTATVMFMFGWNKPMCAEIERRAGPTMLRDIAKIA